MSLPAGQQRVLHGIEGALKASEPQLASMFAIFAQLHQDEPAGGATGLMHRPKCPRALASGSGQPNSKTPASTALASTAPAGRAAAGTASAGDSACTTAVPAPRFTTVGSDSLAVPPLARAGTGTAHPRRMC